MPRFPVDPARLKGEALNRWYQRTPDEIRAERQAAEEARYRDFFGPPIQEPQPPKVRPAAADPDVLWVANGYGGYRATRPGKDDFLATLGEDDANEYPNYLPNNAAAREDGMFTEIGNPYNPRLKREWERAYKQSWPRTADGRSYDVAHIRAIADGGTNTLDNIRPMHPDEHVASHRDDRSRWGKRSSIARTFGGKVEPPAHAPRPARGTKVRGLGILGFVPDILGMMNGRIRTDTPLHFWNDMAGQPSEDDPRDDLIA